MAMTKEQALANARARIATKPAAKRTLLEDAERVALRTGRSLATGVASIADLPKVLITDPLAAGAAYLTEQMGAPETAASIRKYTTENPNPSETVRTGIDSAIGYKAENKWEKMGDTAAEFVTQAGTMGLAAPLVQGAGVAPKAIQAFLSEGGLPGLAGAGGAGVGLEYGKEEFPDSLAAQIGLSLLGAAGAGAVTSAGQAGIRSALDSNFAKDQSGAVKMPGGTKQPTEKSLSRAKTLVYRALVEEQGYTPKEAADLVRQAGKGELPLTLPEMADNITLMRAEKRLRQNAGAAGKVEYDFLSERAKGMQGAIKEGVEPIGKVASPDVAGRQAAGAAKQIVKRAEQIRADKAKPFYDAAYNQRMDAVTEKMALRNPVVQKAFASVQNDPVWGAELAKYPENSLGRFDLTKRFIDDQIDTAVRSGEGAKARILTEAKRELTDTLDEISPMYKEARRVFAKNSPKVEKLQNSVVGLLADMEQGEYAKAGKKLFEGTPTDIKYARRVFAKHPEQWNQLVATHIADVGNKVNNSPLKLLNALSSKTASGSVTKDMQLNAALSPKQIKAKDALFDNLERMTRIRGGSDTAENLMTDAQLAAGLETKSEKVATALTTLRNYKNAPENIVGAVTDWFTLGVRNKNYEELARIFTGEGAEQFADEILRTKPGSPTAYKVIAKRINETSKASVKGGAVGERSALSRIGEDETGSVKPAAAIGVGGAAIGIEAQRQKAIEAARERLKQQAPQSALPDDLTAHEGLRFSAYDDTEGYRTVGRGFNMQSGIARKVWKSAGVQQDFDAVMDGKAAISQQEADALASESLRIATEDASKYVSNFNELSEPRKAAIVNLSYQLGYPRLAKFETVKKHIENGRFALAARELTASKWFKQTGKERRNWVLHQLVRG